jgi:hypothetical protein
VNKKVLLFTALACSMAAGATAADVLVDNFQDSNFVAENWAGAWVGFDTAQGNGLAYRTRQTYPIGFSNRDAQLFTSGTMVAYQYGKIVETGLFGTIAPSDRTTGGNTQKLQFAGLNVTRATAYNASSHKFLRLTAWLPATQPGWANLVDSQFVVQMGEPSPSVNSSVGPWNSDGTTLTGLTLTTTPQSFLIPIDNTTRFKVDPIFTAIFGSGSANLANISSIAVGFRRGATASAGTQNLGGMFFLDDVMLLDAAPGITVTPPGTDIDESGPGNSTTFNIALDAMPTDPVTITVTESDPTQIDVTPATWTFIPSGTPGTGESLWNVPATFTISAIDDGTDEIDTTYTLSLAVATSDLLYQNITLAPLSIVVLDDDVNSSVPMWRELGQ